MTGMTRVVIIQDPNITKYQELLRKLETLGGQKIGRHVVHCRLFNRKTTTDGYSNQRMFMLRMSQNDDLVYAVLVNERAKQQHAAAVSDNGIEGGSEECSLLECGLDGANILQQVEIYAFKSDGQFEGTQYAVGDFVVSVCTFMSRNNQPRGLVIEVQYSPCYTVSSVETLFDEFLANFAPEDRLRKPIDNMHALFDKVFGMPSSAEYSLKHTALQYVAAFNILRKSDK
uniref:Mediator of RNA polymerase II transcription subunit 20 n=1 Tax=Globisporangium ultimum (strain ATCC 200006 / CBS 805.95 / DAOM BR144) TaxID=431595 RepID=K3W9S9_GLOUD